MHKYNNIRLHKYANTQNTNTQIWSCRNTLTEHIKARKLGALAGLFLSATLSFLSCSSQRCTLSGKILRFYSTVLPSIYDRKQKSVLLAKRQSNPLCWRDSMSDLDFCQHQTLAHSHPLCSAFGDDETIKADSASFASFTEFCLRSLPSWWDIMNISASETVWLVYDE